VCKDFDLTAIGITVSAPRKNCHAERSREENEVILAAQSKHPYPDPI
jgi:hypothetical protein